MKEIFDWLREQMEWNQIIEMHFDGTPPKQYVERERWVDVINEAEAKWKEKEAKLRANVIDEFAEAIIVKATELSEKVVFDGKLFGDALSLDCVSDMVLEIASQMKVEKE